jgi:hypothetical protein
MTVLNEHILASSAIRANVGINSCDKHLIHSPVRLQAVANACFVE